MSDRPTTPLDVLLTAMQRKWDAGDLDAAATLARAAAPYLHPRPTATPSKDSARDPARTAERQTRESAPPHLLTDAELDRLLDDDEPDPGGEPDGGAAGEGPP